MNPSAGFVLPQFLYGQLLCWLTTVLAYLDRTDGRADIMPRPATSKVHKVAIAVNGLCEFLVDFN